MRELGDQEFLTALQKLVLDEEVPRCSSSFRNNSAKVLHWYYREPGFNSLCLAVLIYSDLDDILTNVANTIINLPPPPFLFFFFFLFSGGKDPCKNISFLVLRSGRSGCQIKAQAQAAARVKRAGPSAISDGCFTAPEESAGRTPSSLASKWYIGIIRNRIEPPCFAHAQLPWYT